MDYSSIVNIDLSNLDLEYINQSKYYYLVSNKLAEANKAYDEACMALKVQRSQTARNYIASQAKKPTANDIEIFVDLDPDVLYLTGKKSEAEYQKNLLFGVLRSLDHKRDMLKILGWSSKGNENMVV